MSGKLFVIGTGPGNPEQMTPETQNAIEACTDFFGYGPYLDRLSLRSDQIKHVSDNREELHRAREALRCAAAGHSVCVVSGGDPGVFAMAAAICEAIDHEIDHALAQDLAEWRRVDVEILPGITAMLAVAARCGAPLGHDFCAISLSDNLKPWSVIETRLELAARAGFVMAFYNPISKARPWQLFKAIELLRSHLPAQTPVIFGRAAGRPDERILVQPLGEADAGQADMATCVIIGSRETRVISRPRGDLIYTPRFSASDA